MVICSPIFSPAISSHQQRFLKLQTSMRPLPSDPEEDLIQRVSELSPQKSLVNNHHGLSSFLSGSGHSAASRSNKKQHQSKQQQHCDQDFIQLCSLVKDKLNREGITLAAPPFTTKVSCFSEIRDKKLSVPNIFVKLFCALLRSRTRNISKVITIHSFVVFLFG